MALVTELHLDREGETSIRETRAVRVFHVLFDSENTANQLDALVETGIPALGESHPAMADCIVQDKKSTAVEGHRLLYKVHVTYTTATDYVPPSTPNKAPWLRAPTLSISASQTVERALYLDYSDPPKPCLNKANQGFDPPISAEVDLPILTVSWASKASVVGSTEIDGLMDILKTCNVAEIYLGNLVTIPPLAGKLVSCPMVTDFFVDENGSEIQFYQFNANILVDKLDFHKLYVREEGYNQLVGGQLKAILDSDGTPINVPWLLGSDGAALPFTANPANDAIYTEFTPTRSADWSVLVDLTNNRGQPTT